MRLKSINKIIKIPWKFKSFIFSLIEYLNAPKLLYFLQKNVTKRSRLNSFTLSSDWQLHEDTLKKYKTTDFILEFGAGKSLVQNLYLSSFIKKQMLVDLYPMIEFDLVNSARKKLLEIVKLRSTFKIKNLKDLEKYGIYYISPYDVSKTNLSPNSLDACISTNTLEHIPKADIISIFSELNRILKYEGVISAIIDYSDHYAHTDNGISLLNYLKFTPHQWKKYNHNIHYQNRLRHYEYIEIFEKTGFSVINEDLIYAEKNIPLDILDSYKDSNPTWKATSAHIILKKAK